MKNPGYPAGVPTPYVAHVNPYPTRFHGGLWARPVFGMPQIQSPTTVFLPPRDIDMIPDKPYSGLGNVGNNPINAGEGIFRPGGYGGGVFDGNLAGAPSLGRAPTLGDTPGSNPTPSDAANYPYGKYSAQTLALQNKINQNLIAAGACPIIADGKLGPATCGATIIVGPAGGPFPMPTTCQDIKMVTNAANGCGTGPSAPNTKPIPTTASMTPVTSSMPMVSSGTKKVLGFVGGGLLAIGAVYFIKKRRG
jgi:hypothetical protein